MNRTLSSLIARLETNPPAEESLIQQIETKIGVSFPADYRDFLLTSNGAEGSLGSASYIQLWRVQDIPELNSIAKASEFAPGLVLFGSDGGSMSYAFDTRTPENIQYVELPDIPMTLTLVKVLGQTFLQFLEDLQSRE